MRFNGGTVYSTMMPSTVSGEASPLQNFACKIPAVKASQCSRYAQVFSAVVQIWSLMRCVLCEVVCSYKLGQVPTCRLIAALKN